MSDVYFQLKHLQQGHNTKQHRNIQKSYDTFKRPAMEMAYINIITTRQHNIYIDNISSQHTIFQGKMSYC